MSDQSPYRFAGLDKEQLAHELDAFAAWILTRPQVTSRSRECAELMKTAAGRLRPEWRPFANGAPRGSSDPFTPEQRERYGRWQAELVRVLGNEADGGAWAAKYHEGFRGRRETPAEVAPRSEEGFAEAVAYLQSIAPTITPKPGPDYAKIRASRRRR